MKVTLYTTPTCPDCQALKAWLGQKGIAYEEKDLTDVAIQQEAKTRYGVRIAPITVIDDEFFYGTFAEQRPKLAPLLDSRS
jgi:glutaredoxin